MPLVYFAAVGVLSFVGGFWAGSDSLVPWLVAGAGAVVAYRAFHRYGRAA